LQPLALEGDDLAEELLLPGLVVSEQLRGLETAGGGDELVFGILVGRFQQPFDRRRPVPGRVPSTENVEDVTVHGAGFEDDIAVVEGLLRVLLRVEMTQLVMDAPVKFAGRLTELLFEGLDLARGILLGPSRNRKEDSEQNKANRGGERTTHGISSRGNQTKQC